MKTIEEQYMVMIAMPSCCGRRLRRQWGNYELGHIYFMGDLD